MAQLYEVDYRINVIDNGSATIQAFAKSANVLNTALAPFTKLQTATKNLQATLQTLNSKTYTVRINTSNAINQINKLNGALARLQKNAQSVGILNLGSVVGGGSVSSGKSTQGSRSGRTSASVVSGGNKSTSRTTRPVAIPKAKSIIPKNTGYRVLGPSMIDSGGVGITSMLKGMGVAYGIAGLGSLMGNVVRDASEYNNLMATTRAILGTHDKKPNFDNRFSAMEKIIRQVGVETKFTAPEVADASKFLAMAGFDIDAINKSIKPIADIALVGDTDLGQTADVVTNIMTGYGIAPNRIKHAADVMTMTFTKSNTTLMEIAEAYKYSASLLNAGGISFEEATAGLGVLGDAGIKGSQAGTTMRTIMANIVNPTKKQLSNWERIGVKRFGKDGKVRNLVDIFTDLKAKNLYVDDYYKLFHKTAAQGAVSLAENVEKWNEIVELNFLSDSLTEKIAEEKKNTIQGLWAQLTSMFTEDGMQAFESIQFPIRQFLNELINWLKQPAAAQAMQSIGSSLLEIIKFVAKLTKRFIEIYNVFGWVIRSWMKMQMVISAVLIPLRALRGLWNFGLFVGAGFKTIKGWTTNISSYASSLRGATVAQAQFNSATAQGRAVGAANAVGMGGMYSPYTLTNATALNRLEKLRYSHYGRNYRSIFDMYNARMGRAATRFQNNMPAYYRYEQMYGGRIWDNVRRIEDARFSRVSPEVVARYRRMYGTSTKIGGALSAAGSIAGGTIKGGIGAIGGSMLGGAIGEAVGGDSGELWGSMLGGVVGLGAAMLPLAWAAPIAVVGALGAVIWDNVNAIKAGNASTAEWVKTWEDFGVSKMELNTIDDVMIANMRIRNNAMLDEQEKLQASIDLWNRYHHAKNGSYESDDPRVAYQETLEGMQLKGWLETADAYFGKYKVFDTVLDKASLQVPGIHWIKWTSNAGESKYQLNLPGNFSIAGIQGSFDEETATTMALVGMAADPNNPLNKRYERYLYDTLYNATSIDEYNRIIAQGHKLYLPTANWDYNHISSEDAASYPASVLNTVPAAAHTFMAMFEMMEGYYSKWKDIIATYEQDPMSITPEQVQALLNERFEWAFNPQFGVFGTPEWMAKMQTALTDGTFGSDTKTVAKNFTDQFAAYVQWVSGLPQQWQGILGQFLNTMYWMEALPKEYRNLMPSGGVKVDTSQTVYKDRKGVTWTRNSVTGKWSPSGPGFAGAGVDRTDAQINQMRVADALADVNIPPKTAGGSGGSGTYAPGTPGALQKQIQHWNKLAKSTKDAKKRAEYLAKAKALREQYNGMMGIGNKDYKSHYKSANAAPKQVIVNIKSLMSVDKVDLSNPDNAAVIQNLKGQLAQALVDVVHDFDETWNG